MPLDKLIVLTPYIRTRFRKLARPTRDLFGRYKRFVDLSQDEQIPARLHLSGFRDGRHKIEIVDAGSLGLVGTENILLLLCLGLERIEICRIDWAVDLPGWEPAQLAALCRVGRAQSAAIFRSRTGFTHYPHFSKERKILIYDKLRKPSKRSHYLPRDSHHKKLTRFEIQLIGKGVPVRMFKDIRRYSELDLLEDVHFLSLNPTKVSGGIVRQLAFEGLSARIAKDGLQVTAKQFRPPEWAYVQRTFLQPADKVNNLDMRARLRSEITNWLNLVMRFPRTGMKSKGSERLAQNCTRAERY